MSSADSLNSPAETLQEESRRRYDEVEHHKMLQRDYVLRLIEQFARAVASVIRLRSAGDSKAAQIELAHLSQGFLGIDAKLLLSLSDGELLSLFVGSGEHWSAPAILSVYFPDNQKRVYDEGGRVLSIDYTLDNYVDPFLENPRNWRDDYRYDEKGKLLGWARSRKEDEKQQFSAEGHLVLESAKDGTPVRTVPVRYVPKKINDDKVVVEQSPPR